MQQYATTSTKYNGHLYCTALLEQGPRLQIFMCNDIQIHLRYYHFAYEQIITKTKIKVHIYIINNNGPIKPSWRLHIRILQDKHVEVRTVKY